MPRNSKCREIPMLCNEERGVAVRMRPTDWGTLLLTDNIH